MVYCNVYKKGVIKIVFKKKKIKTYNFEFLNRHTQMSGLVYLLEFVFYTYVYALPHIEIAAKKSVLLV